MVETILRDGEVAITSNGDMIMNVNTLIDLDKKLYAPKKEQTNEEAMENVCTLLALLFGPEILDKKPASQKTVRNPEDDKHPAPDQDLYFPLPLIGTSGSAKRHFNEGVYVYVDNYGNVFGTMGECDYRHQMAPGTTQKLVSGKQRLGYAEGYSSTCILDKDEMNLVNLSLYGPKDAAAVKSLFNNKHLVMVVAVPRTDILVSKVATKENTRESRYRAWKNAMTRANKLLNNAIEDSATRNKLYGINRLYFNRPEFSNVIDNRIRATRFHRKEYNLKNQKFPYDD